MACPCGGCLWGLLLSLAAGLRGVGWGIEDPKVRSRVVFGDPRLLIWGAGVSPLCCSGWRPSRGQFEPPAGPAILEMAARWQWPPWGGRVAKSPPSHCCCSAVHPRPLQDGSQKVAWELGKLCRASGRPRGREWAQGWSCPKECHCSLRASAMQGAQFLASVTPVASRVCIFLHWESRTG